MNKDQVLFWLKGYMEGMLENKQPIEVVHDLQTMLSKIDKVVEEPKKEKQLLTENSKRIRRIYPGDIYITDIS